MGEQEAPQTVFVDIGGSLPEKHLALAQLSRDLLEIHCVVRSGCDEFGIAEELLHGLGCYSGRSVSTALEGFLHILHTVQSEPR